jgi:hypothetical protein
MKVIREDIILIETAKWLVRNGYVLRSISVPRGKEYKNDIRSVLEQELKKIGYAEKINFSSGGADIIAQNQDEIWKVECKGIGSGKVQTLRNNFDRALASVVTYFDDEDKKQILALAIPSSLPYLQQLLRISKPLRKILNLWILLIDENDHTVVEYKPEDNIEGVMKQQKKFGNLRQAIENDPELRDLFKSILDKQQ